MSQSTRPFGGKEVGGWVIVMAVASEIVPGRSNHGGRGWVRLCKTVVHPTKRALESS